MSDPAAPYGDPVRFEVDPGFVARVVGAAGDRDLPELRRLVQRLHPADLADAVERMPPEAVRAFLRLIGPELAPDYLADLSWERREEVLRLLPDDYVARALEELDTDDAAAVAADLDTDKLEAALAATDDETRLALEATLAAEEETAGRLMQREFVAAPEYWTVGLTIDHLRAAGDDLPDVFFEVYVVDPSFRPIGAVLLSTLMRSGRETALKAIMRAPQALIRPEMDQEEVAFLFQKYALASAPVIDEAGRITGMVTVDDVVHVISAEGEEDLLRLSGVGEMETGPADTLFRSIRARIPWLALNMATALVASSVIAQFEASIDQLVALAVLMPIVASLGGNAGTQALAVAVRAIAARDLAGSNAWRHVVREALTGVANGAVIGLSLAAAAGLWFQNAGLALAIGVAVVINLTVAGLAGILVPLTLHRLKADPAVSSSVFVTFITDAVGFFAFLGLATFILLR